MAEPIDWARVPSVTLQSDRRVQRNLAQWVKLQEQAGHRVKATRDGGDAVFEAYATSGMRTLALDQFEAPDLATQMGRLRGGSGARPWRGASRRDALGVPSIFRAASLIANTTGMLSMRALKSEIEVAPQDRPRLIVRPDPNRIPRDFYRDSAWNLAHSGEAWWYVSKRDADGLAQALYNVPDPVEVLVEADPRDPVNPIITWRGRSTKDGTLKREDMRQLTFLTDSTGLRGVGPLQLCGAAVSVAVEAQEWAANFYAAGGYPNIWVRTAGSLSGDEDGWSTEAQTDAGAVSEVQRLKEEWISTAPNTPKFTDESILDIKQFDPNPNGSNMLDARNHNDGDSARMFGIPGSLLEYQSMGSSLTYQNLEGEFTKFVRASLRPGYLEVIEQTMTDLLTRSYVSRFNTEAIEAPDVKTRFEVYQLAMSVLGAVEGAEYARKREGLAPGDVENSPVPATVPGVVPRILTSELEMRDVRCPSCQRLVVRASGPVEGWCRHCKVAVAA